MRLKGIYLVSVRIDHIWLFKADRNCPIVNFMYSSPSMLMPSLKDFATTTNYDEAYDEQGKIHLIFSVRVKGSCESCFSVLCTYQDVASLAGTFGHVILDF